MVFRINHIQVSGYDECILVKWQHFYAIYKQFQLRLLSGIPHVGEQKVSKCNLILGLHQQQPLATAQQTFPLPEKRTVLNPETDFRFPGAERPLGVMGTI